MVDERRRGGRRHPALPHGRRGRAQRRAQPHHRARGYARHEVRRAGAQDGAQRLAHLCGQPGRRAGAGGEPAGNRRPRSRADDGRAGRRPGRHRGAQPGTWTGGIRGGVPVRRTAPGVRRGDQGTSGRRVHAGGHDDRDRGVALARLPGSLDARPGPSIHEGSVYRQAVCDRGGRTHRTERHPGSRRLRLQPAVPRRANLSRRPADDHRRGNERSAAAGDLPVRVRRAVAGRAHGGRTSSRPTCSGDD